MQLSARKTTRSGNNGVLAGNKLISIIQCAVIVILVIMTSAWTYVVIQFRKPTDGLENRLIDRQVLREIAIPIRTFEKPFPKQKLRSESKKYVEHAKVGDADDDDDEESDDKQHLSVEEIKDKHAALAEFERAKSESEKKQQQVPPERPIVAANNESPNDESWSRHKISTKDFLKKSLFTKEAHDQVVKKDKKGNILHNAIHSVHKEDLEDLNIPIPEGWSTTTMEKAVQGRGPLVNILHDAGVQELDVAAVLSLPKWDMVTKLYGNNGPVIVGLDTCQQFQDTISKEEASIGIAGLFNTGTNPMNMYLEENCIMPHIKHERHGGMRFQVPWGKHVPASWKWNNTAGNDGRTNKTTVLPVVMVRDPYSWMQSMCKHPYTAKWLRPKGHCPGLVPLKRDKARGYQSPTLNVTVRYKAMAYFDSLADYWTQWYEQYLHADYPRLMVRFEDLQFHSREMIDAICQCAGGVARNADASFSYVVDSAKSFGPGHGGKKQAKTNMISAMIKYGSDAHRLDGLTKEDMQFAATHFNPDLMELFEYNVPEVPLSQ